MTDQEILTKAMEKARGNEWGFNPARYKVIEAYVAFKGRTIYVDAVTETVDLSSFDSVTEVHTKYGVEEIIFSQDFAKAYWGDEPEQYVPDEKTLTRKGTNWQFHLQMMVLEPEPLKYLEKFL